MSENNSEKASNSSGWIPSKVSLARLWREAAVAWLESIAMAPYLCIERGRATLLQGWRDGDHPWPAPRARFAGFRWGIHQSNWAEPAKLLRTRSLDLAAAATGDVKMALLQMASLLNERDPDRAGPTQEQVLAYERAELLVTGMEQTGDNPAATPSILSTFDAIDDLRTDISHGSGAAGLEAFDTLFGTRNLHAELETLAGRRDDFMRRFAGRRETRSIADFAVTSGLEAVATFADRMARTAGVRRNTIPRRREALEDARHRDDEVRVDKCQVDLDLAGQNFAQTLAHALNGWDEHRAWIRHSIRDEDSVSATIHEVSGAMAGQDRHGTDHDAAHAPVPSDSAALAEIETLRRSHKRQAVADAGDDISKLVLLWQETTDLLFRTNISDDTRVEELSDLRTVTSRLAAAAYDRKMGRAAIQILSGKLRTLMPREWFADRDSRELLREEVSAANVEIDDLFHAWRETLATRDPDVGPHQPTDPMILFPDQLPLPQGDANSPDPIARWHALRTNWGRPHDQNGGRPVEMNLQTNESLEAAAQMASVLEELMAEARATNPAHTVTLLEMVRHLRGGIFRTTNGLKPTTELLRRVDLIIADMEAARREATPASAAGQQDAGSSSLAPSAAETQWPPIEHPSVLWNDLSPMEKEQVTTFVKRGRAAVLEVARIALEARGRDQVNRHDKETARSLDAKGLTQKVGRTGRKLIAIPRGMPRLQ